MGLDSSGRSVVGELRKPPPPADAGNIVTARRSVYEILEKSKDLALSIDKSSDRLRGIDDRLPALQAAMRPLHSQSLLMKELGAKIDRAIIPAELVLKTFDIVRSLGKIIKGDPQEDIPMYLASLSQLEEAIQYLSRNCLVAVEGISDAKEFLAKTNITDKYRMHRLNERLASVQQDIKTGGGGGWDMGLLSIALGKLDVAFKGLLLENSEAITLPEAIMETEEGSSPPPLPIHLPAQVTVQLQTIVERLSGHKWVDNILDSYKGLRLATISESLQSLKPDYLSHSTPEMVDNLEWEELDGMIGLWTQQVEIACIILFKSERRLCARVFEKLEKDKWIRCWGKLAVGGFAPFLSFGEGVVESQTAPEKLFKLLDMYEAMENLLPYVFEIFEGADSGCGEVRARSRGLLKRIAHKASDTLWKLSQFSENGQGDAPPDGDRSRLCNYVVNYLKFLVSEYGTVMSKIVRNEKSWQDILANKEDNEDKWLSLVVKNVIQSMERHVLKQSRSYDDPALARIFILNNFWYMITRVKDSVLAPLLGETWMKDSRGKVHQHTMEYQRESWTRPLSYLNRDGLSMSSTGKGAMRELARQRLKNFSLAFEENCQKHSNWVVPEEDLKEGIRLAVTQAVVPAYRGYVQAYWVLLEQGGNIARYMKFTPEQVETMLEQLFEVRAHDGRPGNESSGNSQPSHIVKNQSF